MRQQVNPVVMVVVIILALGLIGFFFVRGMAPHETIISNPNAKIGFEGRRAAIQKMRGQTGSPDTSAPASPSTGGPGQQ